MLKASFNRRVQRPSIQFLNPNVQAANPLNITIGNPYLEPEFTNNYELSYGANIKKAYMNLSLFARTTSDAIQAVRTVKGTDTIETGYGNIGRQDAYGFNIFSNVNPSNKFSLNGSVDLYYAILKNNVPDPLYSANNNGWVYSGRIFANYSLGKDWGLQLFAFYRGRQIQLQGYQGGFGIYSLSLKKDFNEKKGSIGFGAENFFFPYITIRNELNSPVLSQNSANVMYNLNFKINFSYRFGKTNFDAPRRNRKSVTNDDLKEGGDNGGGMPMQGGSGGNAPAGGNNGNNQGKGGPPKPPAPPAAPDKKP